MPFTVSILASIVQIFPRALHSDYLGGGGYMTGLHSWQGPDPRPFWFLVGTPSFFKPELAYSLDGA